MTERPEEHDGSASGSGDDDAWQAIISNYGERAELETPEPVFVQPPAPVAPPPEELHEHDEAHFVPPVPPPAPPTTTPRLAAWFGLFGIPLLMLLTIVFDWELPPVVGLIFMVWFVGGFLYLIATMRQGPPTDWGDDGAVV